MRLRHVKVTLNKGYVAVIFGGRSSSKHENCSCVSIYLSIRRVRDGIFLERPSIEERRATGERASERGNDSQITSALTGRVVSPKEAVVGDKCGYGAGEGSENPK